MKKIIILTSILIICGCSMTGQNVKDPFEAYGYKYSGGFQEKYMNVYGIDIFTALSLNASVYICELKEKTIIPQEDKNREIGIIEMDISNTIYGETKKTIVLPYCVLKSQKTRGQMIWPENFDLADAVLGKDKEFLCVVVPKGSDPCGYSSEEAQKYTAKKVFYGAASLVVAVNGEDNQLVKEYKYICELHKDRDLGRLKEAYYYQSVLVRGYVKKALEVLEESKKSR